MIVIHVVLESASSCVLVQFDIWGSSEVGSTFYGINVSPLMTFVTGLGSSCFFYFFEVFHMKLLLNLDHPVKL